MKKVVPKDAVLIPNIAKRVFTGKIFDVYQWPQTMFDGTTETFEMLKRPDTVTVITIVNNKIVVLEEEQPYTGLRLSFPSGRVDSEDKSLLSAAQREMEEETGYVFNNWRLVKVIQPHSKLEWFIYFYLAWDGQKKSEPKLDAGEKIQIQELPFEKLKTLVLNKAGYLGESLELFEDLSNIYELLALPEFTGRAVDR